MELHYQDVGRRNQSGHLYNKLLIISIGLAKNSNLEAIKLSKEKHNIPLVNQPSPLHLWLTEPPQPVALEQESFPSSAA